MFYPDLIFSTTSWPINVLAMANFWRLVIGGESITIPKGTTHVQERLLSFEP